MNLRIAADSPTLGSLLPNSFVAASRDKEKGHLGADLWTMDAEKCDGEGVVLEEGGGERAWPGVKRRERGLGYGEDDVEAYAATARGTMDSNCEMARHKDCIVLVNVGSRERHARYHKSASISDCPTSFRSSRPFDFGHKTQVYSRMQQHARRRYTARLDKRQLISHAHRLSRPDTLGYLNALTTAAGERVQARPPAINPSQHISRFASLFFRGSWRGWATTRVALVAKIADRMAHKQGSGDHLGWYARTGTNRFHVLLQGVCISPRTHPHRLFYAPLHV
ncbi:hypothetical protein PHLGIDRAFT_471224 [Phlebiopsis gigantea 11061_1 CR5-6]|uniref:Uncharacterized protein n=1 Tax=Phlebiopsis gigantea (strain 11061_1 CR5-6) TaxID=745531 RepID=A0A0C3PJ20_PHLG1|nr:hypothetical protein PHLGIDRAFT_471224 [Phlebiopsis gigantea 11061_1 CR5-6]